MPIQPAGRDLARRIIDLSDKIAEHSKQLSEEGFTPTTEFVEETRRLTEMCRLLMEEADAAHARREKQ
jgi:Na+/phosphate symporter